jgi:hypothetical protein
MAINIPIITEFADKGLKSAQGAFDNFRMKVAEAEGGMGKFKAGGMAALDGIKANAVGLAAAGGAAIAGFAIKAVGDFQDLAISAGKFADATGLSVEESSRWIEVAGDVGVEAMSVQKSLTFMSKAIGENAPAWRELGSEIAYTSSGAVDVNKTFLNTIDALKKIEDPTKRAELAAKTLGRGWQDMAELIQQGSSTLEASLASVGEAKVIDEEELRKARDFRAALDELKDRGEEFALSVGEAIIPILSDLVGVINTIIDVTKAVLKPFKAVGDYLSGDGLEAAIDAYRAHEELNTTLKESWDAYYSSRRAAEQLNSVMGEQWALTQDLEEGWAALLGELNQREAWRNLNDRFDEANRKMAEVFGQDGPEAIAQIEVALDEQIEAIARFVKQMEDMIPDEIEVEILTLLNQGLVNEAKALLEKVFGEPIYQDIIPNPLAPGARAPRIAGGGRRTKPPREGGQMKPGADPTKMYRDAIESGLLAVGGRREGNTVVVNVQGSVISSKDLIEQIRKGLVDSQRNGNQLIYQNT